MRKETHMEIKNVFREVPTEVQVEKFIADDGKVFNTESECIRYENKEKLKHLKITLPDVYGVKFPLINDDVVCLGHSYDWYKLNSEEDFKLIKDCYKLNYYDGDSIEAVYPQIICLEEDNYDDDTKYIYSFEWIINNAKEWFRNFGYEVEIKKK